MLAESEPECVCADRRAEKGIITIYRLPSHVSEAQRLERGSREWTEICKGIKDEESEEEEVRGAGREMSVLSVAVVRFH